MPSKTSPTHHAVASELQGKEQFFKCSGIEFVDITVSENASQILRPQVSSPVTIDWQDITFRVQAGKGKKTLLSSLYGRASPGTLTAVMGPSGAGKTTLLNILSGFYDKGYAGEVHVNGYVRDPKLFKMQSCYVMQDDCLLKHLTVRETLGMKVELCMPDLDDGNISHFVAETISKWGLNDCTNTLVESLSGGEKKRLSIAQELIGNAPLVFLDEPTSGMDNTSALRCVRVLKSLASCGHTVICAIHNPSSALFSHFDRLYVLSEGRCIYNDSGNKLLAFLASQNLHCPLHTNPTDFITEIAAGEHGEVRGNLSKLFIPNQFTQDINKCIDSFEFSPHGGQPMTEKEKEEQMHQYRFRVKRHRQFLTLLKRCFICIIRNQVTAFTRIASCVFFALLLSILYYGCGSRAAQVRDTAALFAVTTFILLLGFVSSTVLILPLEMDVVMREQRNRWYDPSVYYVARLIAELPFTIVCPLIMIGIVHWTTSQPMELPRIAIIALFAIQMSSASQSIGYICSAPLKPELAVIVGLASTAPIFLCSGFLVQRRFLQPAFAWLPYSTPMFYVHRAMMTALFGGGRGQLECDERDADVLCVPVDGAQVLHVLDAEDVDVVAYSGIVLAMDLLLKVIGFALLKWRLRRHR
ncbi:LOW QUALITY PROTEIN: ATP-binding cassette sub-family G member 1-like [Dermacentor silvarum]|uniref:LOW QUALITY PROTEIN: ATP-binding cassette sub-family G member 1-like n=1 Tax=Dermacentor silvarum TaxID=543639 RepID=UPI001897BB6D|nr:LOW QUALITY PROTEIN: ATP-binding cassette sub-family G member 1-like [Dermacentor silvarum]